MRDSTTSKADTKRGADWYRTLVEEVNGHEGYEFVHPDDRERNAEAVEAVLSDPSGPETVEVRFKHADGSWRWIEATMRNRLDDGLIGGIPFSSRDITERKEYESDIRELAEEYEALLDNVEDAIFLVDVEQSDSGGVRFEFERLSPSYERQTGITTEEVQGRTPRT